MWNLPAGVDLDDVVSYAEKMERKRHRDWNRNHPEKVLEQRTRTYINFLTKRGYTILPPSGGVLDD